MWFSLHCDCLCVLFSSRALHGTKPDGKTAIGLFCVLASLKTARNGRLNGFRWYGQQTEPSLRVSGPTRSDMLKFQQQITLRGSSIFMKNGLNWIFMKKLGGVRRHRGKTLKLRRRRPCGEQALPMTEE